MKALRMPMQHGKSHAWSVRGCRMVAYAFQVGMEHLQMCASRHNVHMHTSCLASCLLMGSTPRSASPASTRHILPCCWCPRWTSKHNRLNSGPRITSQGERVFATNCERARAELCDSGLSDGKVWEREDWEASRKHQHCTLKSVNARTAFEAIDRSQPHSIMQGNPAH